MRREGINRSTQRLALTVTFLISICSPSASAAATELASQIRGPIDGVLIGDLKLAVANQRSGSVSLIDLEQNAVLSETTVCESPVDIERLGDDRLLVLDHSKHAAVICKVHHDQLLVEQCLPTKPFPIDAAISQSGKWFAVTSLWSRRLTLHTLDLTVNEAVSIAMPFAPRCVLLIEDQNRIVVADGFGGKIAVIRVDLNPDSGLPASLTIESVREVTGHNIRHLVVAGTKNERRLHLSQMVVSSLAEPLQDEVHWGTYISSGLRSLALKSLLNPEARLSIGSRMTTIGDVRHGSADPGAFVIDDDGRSWVAISGTSEIVNLDRFGNLLDRLSVGEGPTQIIPIDSLRFACINRFSDSVSVVTSAPDLDEPRLTVAHTLSLGPRPKLSEIQRGEALFHSAKLSHDGWMSCHSCHTDGHTCGRVVDTLGDGAVGAAKRVLSLRAVAGTEPLAWNGSMDFDSQVRKSVLKTMHGDPLDDDQTASLVAYLKSLNRLPRQSELSGKPVDKTVVRLGKKHFESFGCSKCHAGRLKTSEKTYDVGLADTLGNVKFNPPSLRGVVHRDRFLHDGRARGLEDLLIRHHRPSDEMTAGELKQLIAYLNHL